MMSKMISLISVIRICCYFLFIFLLMSCRCWAGGGRVHRKPTLVLADHPNSNTCDHHLMTSYLHQLASAHKNISKLVSIGKSVEGRDLWVMILSDRPNKRPVLRPQVKFVGNINGVSGPACFVLLKLIKHLLTTFETQGSVERRLLQTTEIHILPNLNPDGYSRAPKGECGSGEGRLNAKGIELNRNFPDIFGPDDMEMERAPETVAAMDWIYNNNFLISVSLFSGAWVVTYPFDSIPTDDKTEGLRSSGEAHLTPDDDIFKHLASTYVATFQGVAEAWYCPNLERTFPDGMINGAEWKSVTGTMMDFNYVSGTFELMIGIACCRNENRTDVLEYIWTTTKPGLLDMIKESDTGVRGLVMDVETNKTLRRVEMFKLSQNYLENIDVNLTPPWLSSNNGEFWRPLLPGKYILNVHSPGYIKQEIPFTVTMMKATMLTIYLERELPSSSIAPTGFATLNETFTEETIASKTQMATPIILGRKNSSDLSNEKRVDHSMTQSHFHPDFNRLLEITSSSSKLVQDKVFLFVYSIVVSPSLIIIFLSQHHGYFSTFYLCV